MLLYLSSAIKAESYNEFLKSGLVKAGLQAQRFNSLVIDGLASDNEIIAIGFPPYLKGKEQVPDFADYVPGVEFCTIGNINQSRLAHFFKMLRYCKRYIHNNHIEAIICDAISPIYSLLSILLSKLHRIPSIAIVTDIPVIMQAGNKSIITRFSQYLITKHDGYVLLTAPMNKLVNPKCKPFIIMEGLCDAQSSIEGRHNKPLDKTVILYTGSLSFNTGIKNLVEAFKMINRDNIELWIYGGGPAEGFIIDQSKRYPFIKYGGVVSNAEAASLQRKASVLINPRPTDISYAEYSFPSKIMEYMSSGTPVLTTRLAGIPGEYFDYVYSINDDSVEGIYESLSFVLNLEEDQRREMGKRARSFVLTNKNNRKQGERIIDLINQIKR